MSFESAKCAMQLVQRDGMQAALDANRALQTQLELVKDQLDKFVLDNEQQVASIQQLRVNPSTCSLIAAMHRLFSTPSTAPLVQFCSEVDALIHAAV